MSKKPITEADTEPDVSAKPKAPTKPVLAPIAKATLPPPPMVESAPEPIRTRSEAKAAKVEAPPPPPPPVEPSGLYRIKEGNELKLNGKIYRQGECLPLSKEQAAEIPWCVEAVD